MKKYSLLKRTAIGVSSAFATASVLAQNVIAQTTTTGTTTTTTASKGSTATALPNAGTVELTYIIFAAGILLFVVGTIKLVLSYRD